MAEAGNKEQEPSELIGSAVANASKQTTVWYFVLAPLVLMYLWVGFSLSIHYRPLSRLLQLPSNNAEAWLVDLTVVAVPLLAAIALYLRRKSAQDMQRRRSFLAAFSDRTLVRARHNPNLIFAVLDIAETGDITTMQLVWTSDGSYGGTKIYRNVSKDHVVSFDRQQFLRP